MKMKISSRVFLSIIILILGLLISAVPEKEVKALKLNANEMLDEMKSGEQMIHPDQIANMLVEKDPSLLLIDVRSPEEFSKYSLPGAINIPFNDLLSDEWADYIDQDVYLNVFYSNGTTKANEAWMITRQLGYSNNYILLGGLNYWVETILSPSSPKTASPDDEFAKYDFRKAASFSLGGGGKLAAPATSGKAASKPVLRKRKKKKGVKGGCS